MSAERGRIPIGQGSKGVVQFSNELEFNISGADAAKVIKRWNAPSLEEEVNLRDVAELTVSLAKDVGELNTRLVTDIRRLARTVEAEGGRLYGGASVLADVSGLEPESDRTTALSRTFARGLLEISSQQLLLGIDDAHFGFGLNEFLLRINPVLVAITASSPYRYSVTDNLTNLEDTTHQSRRPTQYEAACAYLPPQMWRDVPFIGSLEEHRVYLDGISLTVNGMLTRGELDSNTTELYKTRSTTDGQRYSNTNGQQYSSTDGQQYSYAPFEKLNPNQIFWSIRIRPDHANELSKYSLELRAPDLPATVQGMQMLNSFAVGLAYYLTDHDVPKSAALFDGSFGQIKEAAHSGLDTQLRDGTKIRDVAAELRWDAAQGLREHGGVSSVAYLDGLDRVLKEGSDADLIRRYKPRRVADLRDHLSDILRDGI